MDVDKWRLYQKRNCNVLTPASYVVLSNRLDYLIHFVNEFSLPCGSAANLHTSCSGHSCRTVSQECISLQLVLGLCGGDRLYDKCRLTRVVRDESLLHEIHSAPLGDLVSSIASEKYAFGSARNDECLLQNSIRLRNLAKIGTPTNESGALLAQHCHFFLLLQEQLAFSYEHWRTVISSQKTGTWARDWAVFEEMNYRWSTDEWIYHGLWLLLSVDISQSYSFSVAYLRAVFVGFLTTGFLASYRLSDAGSKRSFSSLSGKFRTTEDQ